MSAPLLASFPVSKMAADQGTRTPCSFGHFSSKECDDGEYVDLDRCNKDTVTHLRRCSLPGRPFFTEFELILARIGQFDVVDKHWNRDGFDDRWKNAVICSTHRAEFGLRFTQKRKCAYVDHPTKSKAKPSRGGLKCQNSHTGDMVNLFLSVKVCHWQWLSRLLLVMGGCTGFDSAEVFTPLFSQSGVYNLWNRLNNWGNMSDIRTIWNLTWILHDCLFD